MLAVRPNEDLPIVRAIDNPNDAATYYIQAVIKNAKTLVTLDTVNLTDNGDRLFSYNWHTPHDAVGLGMYIIIITTVYTDSGYTTKSEVYAEQTDTYKIEINQAHFGGGGGSDIDYRRLRKIIQEELEKLPKAELPKFPKQEKVDLVPVLQAIANKTFEFPKPEKVDLSGLSEGQKKIIREINGIPRTDLTPILEAIDKNSPEEVITKVTQLIVKNTPENILSNVEKLKEEISELFEAFKKLFGDDMTSMRKKMAEMEKFMKSMPYVTLAPQQQSKTPSYKR